MVLVARSVLDSEMLEEFDEDDGIGLEWSDADDDADGGAVVRDKDCLTDDIDREDDVPLPLASRSEESASFKDPRVGWVEAIIEQKSVAFVLVEVNAMSSAPHIRTQTELSMQSAKTTSGVSLHAGVPAASTASTDPFRDPPSTTNALQQKAQTLQDLKDFSMEMQQQAEMKNKESRFEELDRLRKLANSGEDGDKKATLQLNLKERESQVHEILSQLNELCEAM
ncbi:hypothetical protein HDV05_000512 [Chytridiales sp. JEL 0842]|nr:hypothetical protein HDV05_000512 [Chytridiales sp. JEL 0842]